jgi:hypothetical protein
MPVRRLEVPAASIGDVLRERPDWLEVETAGEIRQGQPVEEKRREKLALPRSIVEEGEIVFRARGDGCATTTSKTATSSSSSCASADARRPASW